ncbi:hypothetical protein DM02DRAFT_636019 [Periconia macrospinosa]|uniref:Uncharacterized protein n=1 Tax=Periconia macrospinosa TaxID=97972 RepID=A0A2V1D0M0_9PLEO|nr:hypothetical protein DM02DRAFT_636019 [Periconia macrospinosa]
MKFAKVVTRITGQTYRDEKIARKKVFAEEVASDIEMHQELVQVLEGHLDDIEFVNEQNRRYPGSYRDEDNYTVWTDICDRLQELKESWESLNNAWNGRKMRGWDEEHPYLEEQMEQLKKQCQVRFIDEGEQIGDRQRFEEIKSRLERLLGLVLTKETTVFPTNKYLMIFRI